MPRIDKTPGIAAAKPTGTGGTPAAAALGALLARGLAAVDSMSPPKPATLAKIGKALADAGFTAASSTSSSATYARGEFSVTVATTATSLKIGYAQGKKPLDAHDLALQLPAGNAPAKSAAARLAALASSSSSKTGDFEPDAADLQKCGFTPDPSTSTLFNSDGSWMLDTDRGVVVGFGSERIWPKSKLELAKDTAPAVVEAKVEAPPKKIETPPSAPVAIATWPDAVKPRLDDATLDAVLFLADNRGDSIAATAKSLSSSAKSVGDNTWQFGDGSKLVLDGGRALAMRPDGAHIDVDLDTLGTFHLPLTTETGPAAATLDGALLQSSDAAEKLKERGFVRRGERLFTHEDGSWAVIVPSANASDPPRVAAGVDDRRYVLDGAAAARDNSLAQLPSWLRQMVKLSAPGQDADLQLFAKQLSALDEKMLRALANNGYQLNVTRYRLSNALTDLKDATITGGGAGPAMFDLAEGVHRTAPGVQPSITVRTYLADGQLRIDVSTLVHEIGHAFDLVVGAPQSAVSVRAGAPRDPIHVEQDMADAFTEEHTRLPAYFHTQEEFAAETFAMFMLDPQRCKRMLPKAFAAWDKRFATLKPDATKVFDLERSFDRDAIVSLPEGSTDIKKRLAFSAQQNRVLKQAGVPAQPILALLESKPDWGADAYAADIARSYRASFGKEAGVYRPSENLVTLTAAQMQSEADVEKILTEIETSSRPAVVYVPDASQLSSTSPLFKVWERFAEQARDLPPLLIAGDATSLAGVDGALSSCVRMKGKLEALGPAQQAELASRMAAQEGFYFEPGVEKALEKKLKGGGYQATAEAWRAVKTAQFERQLDARDEKATLNDVRGIAISDVEKMKVATKKSPQERLAEMIGQDEAKRQIDAIVKQAKISALRAKEGLPDPTPARLNMLFSGSPGTGKTTFAEILGELLQEIGFIKNPQVTKVTIQDLLSGNPEAAVKALFEKNKGGVIFIDEMHQLQDTAEGKRAFRAMIPYLADPAYQDTVFIGAGYSDELGTLMRDVDPGAERRFTTVPFLDYTREQLSTIIDTKTKSQNLVLGPEAKDAALSFLDYRRRVVKNFGNAGEVDIALGHAQKAQVLRVSELPADKITKRVLMELVPEDFAIPAPYTKEQFWKEMDAMSGWDDVKERLKTMGASIEGAVRRGKQPTDAVEPYWIIDGPPGTGKSTLAGMLAKFGAAYGLTALPDVVMIQGANFQGEYVGQTAGVVQKQFEKAWGRLMFVDEVSGLARSGGSFKDEAAKMILAQTENHRGKFMMVVADYAENVNLFLGLDPGLPRRFGNRITLNPWTPQQATDDLVKKLAADGVTMKGLDKSLLKMFGELSKLPGYASGGDVRSLKNGIMALIDALGEHVDMNEVLPKAIEQAYEMLKALKLANAAPAAKVEWSDAPVAEAVATKAITKDKEEEVVFSDADTKVLHAFDATNQKLAKQLNGLSLDEITRLENDPKSFFAKELAKQLGVKPEVAIKELVKVRVKVKKLVQKQEVIQRFQYLCPYCGGLDSQRCAYINYPLDWKIEHSLKKPWAEVKTTTQEIETIEEREVGGNSGGNG